MNPYQRGKTAYKQAEVNTKDQGALILMLYDGTIRFLKVGIKKIQEKDLEGAHYNITRAKNIVAELLASLKTENGGQVAENLKNLYTYMYNRLIDANVEKNTRYLEEVHSLMLELREGWKEVIKTKAPMPPSPQVGVPQAGLTPKPGAANPVGGIPPAGGRLPPRPPLKSIKIKG